MTFSDLWNRLRGRKTYLLAMTCLAGVLLRAGADSLQGSAVDWERVLQEVFACLMAMSLRHAVGHDRNGPAGRSCPLAGCPREPEYRTFDR
jgi:hypothetical protein